MYVYENIIQEKYNTSYRSSNFMSTEVGTV